MSYLGVPSGNFHFHFGGDQYTSIMQHACKDEFYEDPDTALKNGYVDVKVFPLLNKVRIYGYDSNNSLIVGGENVHIDLTTGRFHGTISVVDGFYAGVPDDEIILQVQGLMTGYVDGIQGVFGSLRMIGGFIAEQTGIRDLLTEEILQEPPERLTK